MAKGIRRTKWGHSTTKIKHLYLTKGYEATTKELNIPYKKLYDWLCYQDWYRRYQKQQRIERAKRDYQIAIELHLDTCRNVAKKHNVSVGKCGIVSKELGINKKALSIEDKYKIALFYSKKYEVGIGDIIF